MIDFKLSVDPSRMVTIAAVGDVLLHDTVQRFADRRRDGFYSLFKPVADLIQAADISFANLEGPAAEGITKTGRITKPPKRKWDRVVYSGYPMFNYHPSITTALKRAGFDILQTANNHSLDRYAIGADRTVAAIQKARLKWTGTKSRKDRSHPWYTTTSTTVGGEKKTIAWLACTYGTNGIPDKAKQVLHCYKQRKLVVSTVRELAARPDIHAVMVTPHWGSEYRHKPTKQQVGWAHEVLDAGADAVIGTHPHVVQPLEKYRTKDGRETLIAYSLGNFVSNQIGLPRRSSLILYLGLMPDARNKLSVASVGWVPLWMRNWGGVMQAEATDRAGKPAVRNRRHLIRHLPTGNILKPDGDIKAQLACL